MNPLPKPGLSRWFAPMILVVIVALAATGLIALRQDRRSAEKDAEVLAAALADALAQSAAISVADAIEEHAEKMEVLRNGLVRIANGMSNEAPAVVAPPELERWPRARFLVRDPERIPSPAMGEVPEVPDWVASVPHELIEKLESAENAERMGDRAFARASYEFLAKSSTADLHGIAALRLASLEDDNGARSARLRQVASRFDDARTVSGVAVGDIAILHAIAAASSETALGEMIPEVIGRAVFHPSIFSERLLTALQERTATSSPPLKERVAAAQKVCALEENARRVLGAAREEGREHVGVASVNTEQERFFVFRRASAYIETNTVIRPTGSTTNVVMGNHFIITIVPEAVVDAAIQRVVVGLASRWPRYLAADFEMAGQRVGITAQIRNEQTLLATRNETLSQAKVIGGHPFKVSVWLADADLLYSKQRQRFMIFGGLIVLAASAALLGAWQLQKSLTAQVQLNQQKSDFVSSVSHELRAPIASVRLMAESLERGKITEPTKQNEYFRFIGQECRRLSSLIENVLDFSRIEQGRKQYEFEPTDILALVRETVKVMEPYAMEKGVTLNAECGTRSAELNVDGRAMQQALVNLIDNAIKHSPNGEVVKVKLEMGPNGTSEGKDAAMNGAAVLLSVEDRGPGIPLSEHQKIFERFYRLGSELRRETQGVGIGLSIVKHIVEAHHGRVRVESEVGKGSRITIELPNEIKPQIDADERR